MNEYQESVELYHKHIDERWNKLSKDEQLDYFCAVVKRIYEAELVDGPTSYRGVLYGKFGFGPEAYASAQESGYLALHNAIYTAEAERTLLQHYTEFLRKELKVDVTDEAVTRYYGSYY